MNDKEGRLFIAPEAPGPDFRQHIDEAYLADVERYKVIGSTGRPVDPDMDDFRLVDELADRFACIHAEELGPAMMEDLITRGVPVSVVRAAYNRGHLKYLADHPDDLRYPWQRD